MQYWDSETIAIGFTVRPKMMGSWQKRSDRYMRSIITNKPLADKLMPMYTMGCKRVLISDDFYPTMIRDNVELVTDPIAEVRPTGVVTADGHERPVDVIIHATGFKAFNVAESVRIEGRGGRNLADEWRDGPEAFRGVVVAGYPNFFMLMGPNSALGHNSIIFMIEAQVRYILRCLAWLDAGPPASRVDTVEVREDVQRAYNAALQKKFDRSVWKSDGSVWQLPCTSWYVHQSGKNHVLWPGFSVSYWWAMRKPNRRHFLPESGA
jgi:cation diffusion facilitator CzcD-associated flavoprotein CzcO